MEFISILWKEKNKKLIKIFLNNKIYFQLDYTYKIKLKYL